MYDELVKRLRHSANLAKLGLTTPPSELREAADAIEELLPFKKQVEKGMGLLNKADELLNLNAVKPRWIPVAERLPEGADESGAICENVWLLFDDGGIYPGWMNGRTGKVYYLDNLNDVVMKAPISRVKMWQPRPEPPKEEN